MCILNLCSRPEYLQSLREELNGRTLRDMDYKTINDLQLLDSFIKEVMRYEPLDKGLAPMSSPLALMTRRC